MFHLFFKEMDKQFLEYAKRFVSYVLSKEKLVTKTIDCLEIKGKDWVRFVSVSINYTFKIKKSNYTKFYGSKLYNWSCIVHCFMLLLRIRLHCVLVRES